MRPWPFRGGAGRWRYLVLRTFANATARVKLTLVTPGEEKSFKAVFVRPGQYSVIIPAADTKSLAAGTYTLIVESQLRGESPSVESSSFVLF